jgi:hypothetical protein
MMGQKQMTVAGSALRRMILVLAVAAVMAAMMALGAGQALAKPPPGLACAHVLEKAAIVGGSRSGCIIG